MNTTKPFLQFAVPTWNRCREVEVCLRSIAEQIVAFNDRHLPLSKDSAALTRNVPGGITYVDGGTDPEKISILVSDDCSTDGTKEMVERLQADYPFITYHCNEQRVDYSVAFQALFSSVDAEWVWTFGDDDILLPGALETILKLLPDTDLEFVHVVERGRESGSGKMLRGNLLALCNAVGWLDMTGFITGNIARGYVWNECAESPHWGRYAKSAFVQSCVLLENLKSAPCALLDIPLIATQNASQNQACVDRWQADRIGERYLWVGDCIELMFNEGILTEKVKRTFFRYTNYHLWDRHIEYFVDDYMKRAIIQRPEYWGSQSKLAHFIEGDELAASIREEIDTIAGLITLHAYLATNTDNIKQQIQKMCAMHSESYYPWSIVIPKETL